MNFAINACAGRTLRNRLAITFAALALPLFAGSCALGPVSIDRQPASIEKKYFEAPPGSKGGLNDGPDSGYTRWYFHCLPDVKYSVVEQRLTPARAFVKIRVDQLTARLTLPITVNLVSNAAPATVEHEYGHVKICTAIYDHATEFATKCGQEMIGKEFQSDAPDVKNALEQAVKAAKTAFCSRYMQFTASRANTTSEIYDALVEKSNEPTDAAVRDAQKAVAETRPDEKAGRTFH